MLESPLLYTTENGSQAFVHDTIGEFFLASWLIEDHNNIDLFWKRIENPELTDEQERKIKEIRELEETLHRPKWDFPGEYQELGFVWNVIKLYAEMTHDATYFIESALPLAAGPIGGCGVMINDMVRNYLATVVLDASYVSPETIDRFLTTLHSRIVGLSGCGQFSEEGVLLLMLKLDVDPLPYFMKKYDDEKKALKYLGLSYTWIKKPEEGIRCLTRVKDLAPDDPWSHIHLADAYMSNGQFNEALSIFREVKETFKKSKENIADIIRSGEHMALTRDYDNTWLI